MNKIKLGEIANITKLAGFEHTKFIQGNCTHSKVNVDDIPLFIGKTVRNGKIDNNFDWYIPKSISEELPRSQLRKKCIICPYVGSLGDLAIFEGKYEAHLGSNIAKIELVDNKKYTEEFLYYYLKSPYGNSLLLKDTQGAVQKNITMEAIRNVILPNIDYKLQSKISSILKFLDDKIELNNKINSELEAMAKTIYDYWFLQFEFPNEEGKPYKSSGGKMVWNEELKREIPEGWEVETLLKNRLSSFIKTGVEYFEEKNYLATANIVNEEISDGNWITYENRENRANMTPMPNSIWFAKMKNSIKHLTLTNSVGWFLEKYILSTGFIGIKCKENTLGYLHCFINSQYFELKKDSLAHGATQEAVNNEDLNSIKLLIPSYNILNSFNKRIVPLLQKKIDNVKENQELTSLRDFLLPLLMNGQVGFKEEK